MIIKQPVLPESSLLIKTKVLFFNHAPAVKFVAVRIDQQPAFSDVSIRKGGNIRIFILLNKLQLFCFIQQNALNAEDIKIGAACSQRQALCKKALLQAVIAIHKGNVFPFCSVQPRIPRTGSAAVSGVKKMQIGLCSLPGSKQPFCAIFGSVIDYNQLAVFRKLRKNRVQTLAQICLTIIGWDDDR